MGSHFIYLALKSSSAIGGQVQTLAPVGHMGQGQVKIGVVSMAGEVLCPVPTGKLSDPGQDSRELVPVNCTARTQ